MSGTLELAAVCLGDGCDVGINATILPGVTVGRGAQIGAGAVVVHDVPDFAVVVGNPARVLRLR
jgi:acetyltransferase-like isoleucine patch superfamily enzyme